MRVIIAQLNPKVGDLDGNTQKIIRAIDKARGQQADLIVFPELAICGYFPYDLLWHRAFIESIEQHLEEIVRASKGIMVIVGLARRNVFQGEKPLLNSAAVIMDGHLLGFYDKWLLPTYDVFDERRYFEPGHHMRTWELKGKKIGVIICEDMWQHAGYFDYGRYARDPILELATHKPDLLINISASPYHFQKPDQRLKVCAKAARTLQCPAIMSCQVGANDQLIFDGYSIFVNAKGELQQVAKGFDEDEMVCDLDIPSCSCPFQYDSLNDLYNALCMGLHDYFIKSRFTKACIGLSGGIDSALAACMAADALGPENVLCISLPSRYTATMSQDDAAKLAKNLGVYFKTVSIEEPFETLLSTLSFKEPIDITEENLQARIRGTILMAHSNKYGHIVLSTGNKSEMAMGYCTLYGDMCGGLSILGDVTKTQVYALACMLNQKRKGLIPQRIIDRPPSAELKPNQTDQDTLPDYAIVDQVLEGYVEYYLSPDEIAERYSIPIEIVLELIQRIHNAEYKRRQAAPMLRVTRKSFSVGRRYPIVQGWM